MANRVPAKAAREARNGAVRGAAQPGVPAARRQPTPRMSPPTPATAAPEPELPGPEVASSVTRAVAAEAGRELPGAAPGWRAFLRSFVYAWRGLWHAVRTQRNARVHLTIAAAAIALGLWLGIAPVEWAMVFVAITGVFVAEMFEHGGRGVCGPGDPGVPSAGAGGEGCGGGGGAGECDPLGGDRAVRLWAAPLAAAVAAAGAVGRHYVGGSAGCGKGEVSARSA